MPTNAERILENQKRLDEIMQKLAGKKGQDVNSSEVTALMIEYDSIARELFQLPDPSKMILDMATAFRSNPEIQTAQDKMYGEGATEFIGRSMEAFYLKK